MSSFGIIGCGNMGGAILRSVANKKLYEQKDIHPCDKNDIIIRKLRNEGYSGDILGYRAAAESDILMLAIKPQMLRMVCKDIKDEIDYSRTTVISIAPGFTLGMLEEMLSSEASIVRCMPNTPAMIGEGISAVCRNGRVTDTQFDAVKALLSCTGSVEEINENLIDAVVGVSGSSPAYVFMFIDALANAGVRAGMTKPQALRFAAQAVAGSARFVIESGLHPAQLCDMVCSPAGTTIDAVAVLENKGFRSAVMEAAGTATEKSRQMAQK